MQDCTVGEEKRLNDSKEAHDKICHVTGAIFCLTALKVV